MRVWSRILSTDRTQDRIKRTYETMSGASVGIEMAVCVAIGWGIGYLLDRTFGTEPWLMLVFLGCGIAAGFKALYQAAQVARPRPARPADSARPEPESPTATADNSR